MPLRKKRLLFAPQGWRWFGVVILSALLVFKLINPLASLPLWLLSLFCLYLFRDPSRRIPPKPLAIVAPIDGHIIQSQPQRDPYLGRDAHMIRIKINTLGCFTIRSPIEGKITRLWLQRPESVDHTPPHHSAISIETDEGDRVIFSISHRFVDIKPACFARVGQRIGQGKRCGMARPGMIVELYLPISTRIDKNVGDKICAGSGILAHIIRQKTPLSPAHDHDRQTGTF